MTDTLETRVARIEAVLGLAADAASGPVDAIVQDAAAAFRVDRAAVLGSGRGAAVVDARHAAIWTVRHVLPDTSLRGIAHVVGRSDHTTILSALRRADRRRDDDPAFRRTTDDLARLAKKRMPA